MPVAMSGTTPGYASTSVAPRAGEPFEYRVAVGGLADVAALKQAIDAGDDSAMGRLLGFPACCIAFFRRVWVNDACVDTTWAMAANSGSPGEDGRLIEVDSSTPFQANILWRWMGVRAVPHLPCSFSCPHTVDFANLLMGLGRDLGYRGRDGVAGGDPQLAGVLVCAARHRRGEDARAEGVDPHRCHRARVRRAPGRPPDA